MDGWLWWSYLYNLEGAESIKSILGHDSQLVSAMRET